MEVSVSLKTRLLTSTRATGQQQSSILIDGFMWNTRVWVSIVGNRVRIRQRKSMELVTQVASKPQEPKGTSYGGG